VVPARFLLEPTTQLDESSAVFVVVVYERDRVLEAVRAAGFRTVADRAAADYVLEITIGAVLAARPCGTLSNVRLRLSRGPSQEGRRIAEISARGWTGTCVPNVLDEASTLLASRFGLAAAFR
jgi:hypothetical protein